MNPTPQRRSETKRVEYHNNRASRVGLAATLTKKQWLQTLEYYNWQCAFCSGPYEVLEHFVPLIHGGGTTAHNCIPACANCNRIKHDKHPSAFSANLDMRRAIQDIQKYLDYRCMFADSTVSYSLYQSNLFTYCIALELLAREDLSKDYLEALISKGTLPKDFSTNLAHYRNECERGGLKVRQFKNGQVNL